MAKIAPEENPEIPSNGPSSMSFFLINSIVPSKSYEITIYLLSVIPKAQSKNGGPNPSSISFGSIANHPGYVPFISSNSNTCPNVYKNPKFS